MTTSIRHIVRPTLAIALLWLSSTAFAGSLDDFFAAIRNDNAASLKELLQRGFDPNTRDEKGQPGLTIAMREQSPKTARVLLDQPGIAIEALNAAGESALMIAAIKGDVADMKLLLDRGAHVDQPGWSAIHYAATGPEAATVKLLLEHGASVDALSPNGSTPLMLAAQYGSEESVKLLIDRGADIRLRNQKNLGPVDFARLAGRDYLVKRLEALQR